LYDSGVEWERRGMGIVKGGGVGSRKKVIEDPVVNVQGKIEFGKGKRQRVVREGIESFRVVEGEAVNKRVCEEEILDGLEDDN